MPSGAPEAVALGEALVDLVPAEGRTDLFTAAAGGAPANVAAGLARLGRRSALVARVGRDRFGAAVTRALEVAGVDTRSVIADPARPTPLAVVQPGAEEAERFVLYRAGAADGALAPADVPVASVEGARVLHVGALSLSEASSRAATLHAIRCARRGAALVSVDLNLRPPAWPERAAMVAAARELISLADLVKLNREELELLEETPESLLAAGATLVAVTEGEHGATLVRPAPPPAPGEAGVERLRRPAARATVVDGSGAGDAFVAGLLHGLLDADPRAGARAPAGSALLELSTAELEAALELALAAGTAAVERVGAMDGLAALAALGR